MKMKQIKPRIMVFDKRQKKPKGKSRMDIQETLIKNGHSRDINQEWTFKRH